MRACAVLARAPGLAASHVRAAVARAGGLGELLAEDRDPQLLPRRTEAFLRAAPSSCIDRDLKWLDATGAALIPCTSARYPPGLTTDPAAPPALYVLGNTEALGTPQIAMVGARAATAAGIDIAQEFARAFARLRITVTSGLAVGIDAASHTGALAAGGRTIAVCGHGLDRVYPEQNRALAARVREHGALVSQYPPGTPPRPELLVRRNRLLSGLALATLVVEADARSGSLATARHARDQGRPVFAVPGSIRNPLAAGCHALIRSGARLARGPNDVLELLNISFLDQELTTDRPRPLSPAERPALLDKASEMLLDAVGFEPVSINTLVERTGLPSGSIASMLLILELRGRVAPHPGGRYVRLS